jgi:hypothetical protein
VIRTAEEEEEELEIDEDYLQQYNVTLPKHLPKSPKSFRMN